MIYFSKRFPKWKYPLGYLKLLKAHFNYFDHLKIDTKTPKKFGFLSVGGYQSDISKLRDKHKGKRGFIIANGPSLQDIDMSLLKDEITIGCNGIFNAFEKWGFHTTYFMTEDQEQTEAPAMSSLFPFRIKLFSPPRRRNTPRNLQVFLVVILVPFSCNIQKNNFFLM